MSDAGIYAALEADLLAKAGTVGGVTTLKQSLNVWDTLYRDGFVKPEQIVVGLVHAGTKALRPARGVNAPQVYSSIAFQFVLAAQSLRGGISQLPAVELVLEAIRAAVHFKQPSALPVAVTGLYRWDADSYPAERPKGLLVATSDFHIELMLGN